MSNGIAGVADDQGKKAVVIATYVAMGLAALLLLIQLSAAAKSPANAVMGVLMCGVAIWIQVVQLKKIDKSWHVMKSSERWRTGLIAVLAPLLVLLGLFVLMLFVMLWFWGSVVPRLLGKSGSPVGSSIFRAIFSTAGALGGSGGGSGSGTDFGSSWGDQRVHYGAGGQPIWVGDQEVRYGADGRPAWVGEHEVRYGGDGRMNWVGDDQVHYGGDGSAPKWVGGQSVQS